MHNFFIGEIVSIINIGEIYSAYETVYNYFYPKGYNTLEQFKSYSFKVDDISSIKWIIKGVAKHPNGYYLYFLMSPEIHKVCLIGESGICLYPNYNQEKRKEIILTHLNDKIPQF